MFCALCNGYTPDRVAFLKIHHYLGRTYSFSSLLAFDIAASDNEVLEKTCTDGYIFDPKQVSFLIRIYIWAPQSENVSWSMRKMHRFSKVSFGHLFFIDTVYSVQCFCSGQWRPWSDCADAQADLGLRYPHMHEKNVFAWRGPNVMTLCMGGVYQKFYFPEH